MTLDDALSEIKVIIDREALLATQAAQLRAKYGAPAAGRVVVTNYSTVQADEAQIIKGIEQATEQNARELHLLIDGQGGHVTSMWRIVEALQAFKGKTRGVVLGKAPSASAVIFVACDERIAPPGAEFLIHSCGFYKNDSRYPYTPPRYTAASLSREVARFTKSDIRSEELF